MEASESTDSRRDRVVASVMLAGIVALVAAATAVNLIFFLTPHASSRTFDFFQLDAAHNPGAWFSSVQLFLCAFLALQLAGREGNARRRSWITVAVLCVAMSIDEGLSVHELLTQVLKSRFKLGRFSVIGGLAVALPLIVVVTAALSRMLATLPEWARRRLILSGTLFVTGAVGVETIGARFAAVFNLSPGFYALATVEEALEMAGVWLFFVLLLRLSRLPATELHSASMVGRGRATLKDGARLALPILAAVVASIVVIEKGSFQVPSDVKPMASLPSLTSGEGSPGVNRLPMSVEFQAGRFPAKEVTRLKWKQQDAVATFEVPVGETGEEKEKGDVLELYLLSSSFSGTFELAVDGRAAAVVALCQRGHRLFPRPPLALALPALPASATSHRVTVRLVAQDERCPVSQPELTLAGWRLN